MKRIELDCPSKVNLLLKVLGKRPDGFHELLMVMQAIDLADHLEVWRKPGSLEFQSEDPEIPKDDRNLVVKAAQLFLKKAKIKEGVGLKLIKKVPVAAGLGGGSSDAAHTLLALNRLFDQPLSSADLHLLAAELGSDVPFFLTGGVAICRGRGEKVEPLPYRGKHYLVLINPGIPLSTKEVYGAFGKDYSGLTEAENHLKKIKDGLAKEDVALLAQALSNDLERGAIQKLPLLNEIKDCLLQSGGAGAMVSGSGPTLFAIVPDKLTAERACDNARKLLNKQAAFRYFVAKGVTP